MATLSVVQEAYAGIDVAEVAAAGGGDSFPNNGQTRCVFVNGSGGSITVTIVTSGTDPRTGLAIADQTVVVAAGKTMMTKTLPTDLFGTTVSMTYSDVTSFTVAVIKE